LLLKAPNSVILKEEHRIRGKKNGYKKLFGPFSDLRRWRKLPHEKPPFTYLLHGAQSFLRS